MVIEENAEVAVFIETVNLNVFQVEFTFPDTPSGIFTILFENLKFPNEKSHFFIINELIGAQEEAVPPKISS